VTSSPLVAKPSHGRRRSIWLAAPVALLLVISGCGSDPPADPSPQHRLPSRQVTGDRPAPRRAPLRVAPPRRIRIPAIGVSAPVIPLGLNKDRTIQVPKDFSKTGWYRPGPEPGEVGPAVIVGHVDSKTGPAVFFRIRELKPGNRILIRRADGSTVRFHVNGLERWPKAEFPTRRVYGRTRGPVLRLVTCSGAFDSSSGHYVDNTIVFATRL
jgi:sortase family protein